MRRGSGTALTVVQSSSIVWFVAARTVVSSCVGADQRHRTAKRRGGLSRPVRIAAGLGLITVPGTFFDYGCGRGEDVDILAAAGMRSMGWDPYFRPGTPKTAARVVNLGYVLNVIADPVERRDALREAWALTEGALVVAVRLDHEIKTLTDPEVCGDGCLTGSGTFQRFYTRSELRRWMQQTLGAGVDVVDVAAGVVVASRPSAVHDTATVRVLDAVSAETAWACHIYETHRADMDVLVGFFAQRGRLPARGEAPELCAALRDAAGTLRIAWRVATTATPDVDWAAVTTDRRVDTLAALALTGSGSARDDLSAVFLNDVAALVGPWVHAATEADTLMGSILDPVAVRAAVDVCGVGKRLPQALYVHRSALTALPWLLQGYERCARRVAGGTVADAEIVKLATDRPAVSYLHYPAFDSDPHPELRRSVCVHLGERRVSVRDYSASTNPPLLHRKECFVIVDYPHRQKFERLTRSQERLGLLDDPRTIGHRRGWNARLAAAGMEMHGHRVVRTFDVAPVPPVAGSAHDTGDGSEPDRLAA